REGIGCRELLNRRTPQQPMVSVLPTVQHHLTENSQIAGRGKYSRVSSNAAHYPAVFIVNLPTEQPLAKRLIVLRRRNIRPQRGRRSKHRRGHFQRGKDSLLRGAVEWLAYQSL